MSDNTLTVELELGDDEGILAKTFPDDVWLRVKGGGMNALIEVQGPTPGVVLWVNTVYSGGAEVPPILNNDGSWANEENPGLPLGY